MRTGTAPAAATASVCSRSPAAMFVSDQMDSNWPFKGKKEKRQEGEA